jgi:hypothetical protein
MVKNTVGGKKGKTYASKNVGGGGSSSAKLRVSMNPSEVYVCVTKVLGSGMFEVVDNNNQVYKAILRGKMKGPNKRFNLVSLFSFLLVGLRDDLSKTVFCDILFVYESNDIRAISIIPNSNISNLVHLHHSHSFPDSNSIQHDSLFDHHSSDIHHDLIPSGADNTSEFISHSDSEHFDFDHI